MNTARQMYKWNNWQDINWKVVECQIFKLQKRIYKASQRGDVKLVHRLQRLLIHSYYGKLWATRRITQENVGKKTAGVDGIKELKPKQRFILANSLKLGNKVKYTRRVCIPKPDRNEKRPLGIPTMYERALQGLVKLALEPEWEAVFEPNSYGFRPGRSAHDAIEAIFNAITFKPKYVLDADIAKCFDKINHSKLLDKLNTYPTLRNQVRAWLKCGVMDKGELFQTNEGTPQGGVLSPLLANIALHGMEERIKAYARTFKGRKCNNEKALSLIRYADDFVISHENLEVLFQAKEVISEWLSELGLELKPSKTKITHTLNEYEGNVGFDFLGFTIRQFPKGKDHSGKFKEKTLGFKTIIKPSKEKLKTHIKKCNDVRRKQKNTHQKALIIELNPIIKGWSNYYSSVCSQETFENLDAINYRQLRRWASRRHHNKNRKWIANKYWPSEGNRNWGFYVKTKTEKGEQLYKLRTHSETPIVRYTKVKGTKSPFDGDMVYWASRMGKYPEINTRTTTLLKRQKGKCNHCGLYFRDGDLLETDHIIPKSLGGKDTYNNLQILHRHCHDIKTRTDGSLKSTPVDKIPEKQLLALAEHIYQVKVKNKKVMSAIEYQIIEKAGLTCIHDKESITEERNEVKVSRSVLKTSRNREVSA
ncbi:MAG: group II intron reverse transcriptase/maturase [Moorea sp. SIO2B7]|nr:group II intron reverse transcriptase/maturase [Moorena sp. SIO2B7]